MIHVLAIVTTQPGQREAVLQYFRANMPAVHAEKGCVSYAPTIDAPGAGPAQALFGDDTFVVVEAWETLEDLEAHRVSPHMTAYGDAVKDLLATRTIHILTPA